MRNYPVFIAILLAASTPALAEKWKIQYFYDEGRDTFVIEDMLFPSAQRGIAVGTILDEMSRKKPRYTAIVTSDGGAHWTQQTLTEHPRSIYFLNDSQGWMVTDDGFWYTEESGRSWKKIAPQIKPDKKVSEVAGGLITRVWFITPKRGFGIGLQKAFYETNDGGVTWSPILEAAQPPAGNPSFTAYTQIVFENAKTGMIFGVSHPPRRDDPRFPEWMEPERATKRRQVPTLTIELKTIDGGEHWRSDTAPLFGTISSVQVRGADSISVYQYDPGFSWPAEVFHLDRTAGKITTAYKSNLRVMDCALFDRGKAFLAGVEPPGKLNTVPIPGKIRILTSSDFTNWTDMDVDYKANARAVMIAGPDPEHLWVGTDTGMILHLVP